MGVKYYPSLEKSENYTPFYTHF